MDYFAQELCRDMCRRNMSLEKYAQLLSVNAHSLKAYMTRQIKIISPVVFFHFYELNGTMLWQMCGWDIPNQLKDFHHYFALSEEDKQLVHDFMLLLHHRRHNDV